MKSDGDKIYIKIIELGEIENFVFLESTGEAPT